MKGQRRGASWAPSGRRDVISLTIEPTPGYSICITTLFLSFLLCFCFYFSTLVRDPAVKGPVTLSVVMLEEGWMCGASVSAGTWMFSVVAVDLGRCSLEPDFFSSSTSNWMSLVSWRKSKLLKPTSPTHPDTPSWTAHRLRVAHLSRPLAYLCTAHFLNERIGFFFPFVEGRKYWMFEMWIVNCNVGFLGRKHTAVWNQLSINYLSDDLAKIIDLTWQFDLVAQMIWMQVFGGDFLIIIIILQNMYMCTEPLSFLRS